MINMNHNNLSFFFIVLSLTQTLSNEAKAQGFTIDINPQQKTILAGDLASFDIIVNPTGGFSASVAISLVLPNCIDDQISISPGIANFPYNNIKINISNSSIIAPATYPIQIFATAGPISDSDSCFITILPDTNNCNWTIYQTINSGIQSNVVVESAVDKHGHTWFVSKDTYGTNILGNLTHFDGTLYHVYTEYDYKIYNYCGDVISVTNGNYLPDHMILSIAIDSLDNKWIGTRDEGVVKIDSLGNWTYYHEGNSLLPDNYVENIEIDQQGRIWMCTSGGLVKIVGGTWTIYDPTNSILPAYYVYKLAFDQAGNIWFCCGSCNLVKFDGTFFTIYNSSNSPIPCAPTQALYVDSLNYIWISFSGYGLYKFDGINSIYYRTSNSNILSDYIHGINFWQNKIFALCEDGSTMVGLSCLNGSTWTNYTHSNSCWPPAILGIPGPRGDLFVNRADNSLWISSGTAGLIHIYDSSSIGTLVQDILNMNTEIGIYPNPFSSIINIDLPAEVKNVSCSIQNIYGSTVCSLQIKNTNVASEKINLDFLSNGVYFFQIIVDGQRRIAKVVIKE